MIAVDTSVWINYFGGRPTPSVVELRRLLAQDLRPALTDLVLTELLQGVRSDRDRDRLERRLSYFPVLRLGHLTDFRRSADLYRHARRQGITIRSTVDCLIASVCIREAVPILHDDADFDRLASVSPLVVHPVG